jgi:hypothetical protein
MKLFCLKQSATEILFYQIPILFHHSLEKLMASTKALMLLLFSTNKTNKAVISYVLITALLID